MCKSRRQHMLGKSRLRLTPILAHSTIPRRPLIIPSTVLVFGRPLISCGALHTIGELYISPFADWEPEGLGLCQATCSYHYTRTIKSEDPPSVMFFARLYLRNRVLPPVFGPAVIWFHPRFSTFFSFCGLSEMLLEARRAIGCSGFFTKRLRAPVGLRLTGSLWTVRVSRSLVFGQRFIIRHSIKYRFTWSHSDNKLLLWSPRFLPLLFFFLAHWSPATTSPPAN